MAAGQGRPSSRRSPPGDRRGRGRRLAWLAAILLLAFAVRLWRLGQDSLWYDETVSLHLAGESVPAMLAHTAGDIHPPGYYLLLHGWLRIAGSSEFAAAFLSVWFGLLLVALSFRLASSLLDSRTGVLAALLVAISPYHVWYSQEVRMYTLAAALGLGLLACTLVLLRARPAAGPSWLWLAGYALCGALGLWVLYYFAFLVVAINLMVGAWWAIGWRQGRLNWGWLGRWLAAQAAVVLLYAPWLPYAWRQAAEPPVPPWRGFTPLGSLIVETWSALSLGQSVQPARAWPVLLGVAVLFGLGLLYRSASRDGADRGDRSGWLAMGLLAGSVFVPVLLIYLASFVTPLYHVRYAFPYSTPFYLVLGAGLAWLWQRSRAAMALSLAVLAVSCGLALHAYHTDPRYASDDHRGATRLLADRWRPGDAILIDAGYVYTAFLYYWDGDPIGWRGRLVSPAGFGPGQGAGDSPMVLQAGTVDGGPSLGWGSPGSDFYAMSQADTAAALSRLFADVDRVWLYRCYDTVTDGRGFIRQWLDDHGTLFEDQVFSGEAQLRVQGFLTGRDPEAGASQPQSAALTDGSLRLLASAPLPLERPVGGAVDVVLVWRVESRPAQDLILFAGLFDEAGQRWAQTDERPLGSLYPVGSWPEGARVRTPLRVPIPGGTPPGRYRLEIGWYRFVDGQPIWLPLTAGDRLALGELVVARPASWRRLPLPSPSVSIGLTVGDQVRLVGWNARRLEAHPGEALDVELVWQAMADRPEPGLAALQLVDDAGHVLAEVVAAPVGGRLPFVEMEAGQTVLDRRSFPVPAGLLPGVYDLRLARQRPDGTWMPVRRGAVRLGSSIPLATVRVLGGGD